MNAFFKESRTDATSRSRVSCCSRSVGDAICSAVRRFVLSFLSMIAVN